MEAKKLRDLAWLVQNKTSDRPGIGAGTSLPEQLKREIHRLTNSVISSCTDFENGYLAQVDFEDLSAKQLVILEGYLTRIEASSKEVVDLKKLPKPKQAADCQTEELQTSTGASITMDEIKKRIIDAASIDLSKLGISDQVLADVMTEISFDGVENIDLRNNNICDAGAQQLAAFLVSGTDSIASVDLRNNPIGEIGRLVLSQGLRLLKPKINILL